MKIYTDHEAVNYLNDQFWHDSVLYEIRIIRANSLDQVVIPINLIIDDDEWVSHKTTLIFNDCYYVQTKINGGISCMSDGEMISDANANLDSNFINEVKKTWEKTEMELPNLFHFSMELASTGSEIDIVCASVGIELEGENKEHSAPPPIYIKKK